MTIVTIIGEQSYCKRVVVKVNLSYLALQKSLLKHLAADIFLQDLGVTSPGQQFALLSLIRPRP